MIITLSEAIWISWVIGLSIFSAVLLGKHIALKLKRENDKRKSSK
jgi:hypothetical protein